LIGDGDTDSNVERKAIKIKEKELVDLNKHPNTNTQPNSK